MKPSPVVTAVEDVLQQGLFLLSEADSATYATVVAEPFAASVGQHYRHVLDHFFSLIASLDSGRVDYDARGRDRRIETDLEYAREITVVILQHLQRLSPEGLDRTCTVAYSVGYRSVDSTPIYSTVARELAFCVGHAIHHFAIVRLLCAQLAVSVPAEFGIAPSTLRYRAAQGAN